MVKLIVAGAAVVAGAALAVHMWRRKRITPAEKERRRCRALAATGKLGDGNLLDMPGDYLLYSYDVRGVTYTASQDISALQERLPAVRDAMFGPILVKYDPKNPANSIVLSEEWSGFRNFTSH